MVKTLWNSLHVVLPNKHAFVGLANFAELARDDIFWRAVRNTLVWACTSPLFEVSIALVLALALYAKVPGARFFRIAWFTTDADVLRGGRIIWPGSTTRLGRGQLALRAHRPAIVDARLAGESPRRRCRR